MSIPLFSAARSRRAALLSFGHVGLGQCLHQGISQTQELGVEFDNIGPGFSPTLVPTIPPLNLGTIGCGHIDVSPFTVFADHEDSGGMQLASGALTVWISAGGAVDLESALNQRSFGRRKRINP
jgi:hypothetical protein